MKRTIIFLSLFTTIIASCKSKHEANNYIIAVDFSSSRDSSIVEWYLSVIETNIISNMGMQDQIVLIPIDRNSELWAEEIFKADFNEAGYDNEFAGLDADKVSKKNFQDSVNSKLVMLRNSFKKARFKRQPGTNETDIIGALKVAKKYFVEDYHNYVIFFSDMQQFTKGSQLNFETAVLSPTQLDKFLQSAEVIPLPDSKVIVLTGSQAMSDSKKFNLVKNFWQAYFKKSGAELVDYSSASVTLLDRLVSKSK